jgi:acyl-CoA thioesterase-1
MYKSNDMRGYRKTITLALALSAFGCGHKGPSANSAGTMAAAAVQPAANNVKTILVFGDSLTAGYGLDDPSEAFPGVIQSDIDSLKLQYHVINAGVSGETSAGGLSRIGWVLKQKPAVFLLELGANDGLRGIPVKQTQQNLQAIIDSVKTKYPAAKIILLGMQIPPSMGQQYAGDFKKMYPSLAAQNHIGLVPFLLDKVGGIPSLNQADGIHPNAAGAKITAANVWQVLRPVL